MITNYQNSRHQHHHHEAITQLGYRKSEHQDDERGKGFENSSSSANKRKSKRRVYKHLFRHYGDISFDSWLRCEDPESFLGSIGYTQEEVKELVNEYPPLLDLNVHDHLAPKARFLVETMGGGEGRLAWNPEQDEISMIVSLSFVEEEEECSILEDALSSDTAIPHSFRLSTMAKQNVPADFFGCSLDRKVGPYHAYLQHHGLLHGPELLADPAAFQEFLTACKSIETFSALCQQWSDDDDDDEHDHSTESITSFLDIITQGLLPIAKEEASYFVDLLLEHGYNPLESGDANHDTGVGPLHWLAGRGKLAGTQELVQVLEDEHDDPSLLDLMEATREHKMGATPFHWAASGMTPRVQGCGGSLEVCHWMMDRVFEDGGKDEVTKLCNLPCWTDQATPLMYAAWGGNLQVCQLLMEGGADPLHVDKDGQNALHWAAASGHLEVCQFLAKERYQESLLLATTTAAANEVVDDEEEKKDGEDLVEAMLEHGQMLEQDNSGSTPLDYAIQFDHEDIIEWMMQVL